MRRRERRNRVKQLRWQQRSLPDSVMPNLSLAEKEVRAMAVSPCLLIAVPAQACPGLVLHGLCRSLETNPLQKSAVVPEVRPAAERLHAHGRPGPDAGAISFRSPRDPAVVHSLHRPNLKLGLSRMWF